MLQTPQFVEELHQRLDGARHRVLVQLMTFDGDRSGQDVAARLLAAAARGVKVQLLVDCFALRFVSDQPVGRPAVRDEAAATTRMYERLRDGGVDLTFTQPNGRGNLYALARNHKKLFVIDDDVYLGGINVSDHNFSWHDFMIRIDDEEIRQAVVSDFEFTRAGGRRSVNEVIVTNREVEDVFNGLVLNAKESIELASPYAIDVGLTQLLAKATAPKKTVLATKRNNFLVYRAMSPYLKWRLRRAGVSLATYTNFSHSKFLLVDGDKLLVGSSNFGRHSFWCNQEICLLITDPDFIREFRSVLMARTEPLEERQWPHKIAFGGLVSWIMYTVIMVLRFTVAKRVPNLSNL
ncbi:MAG: phosphatidylserine/phosphatidylglycerophosphate/cardiolipin synthase family protein [Actinomycetota bacterium]